MANTINNDFVKTHTPTVIEQDTLSLKKALTKAEIVADNEALELKEVSAADSTKLQYFHEVNKHMEILNRTLTLAESRTEISQDASLARQLALNSITNMLSSMDTVALTVDEKNILQQNYTEMANILLDANHQQSVEDLPETTEDISPLLAMASSAPDFSAYRTSGDNIICDKLAALLGKADEEYLQVYEYASKIRAEFQEKIAEIQQAIPNHISIEKSNDDYKGNIIINAADIDAVITSTIDLRDSYTTDADYTDTTEALRKIALYPPNYNEPGTQPLPNTPEGKAEAEYWAKEFPGAKVQEVKTKVSFSWGGPAGNDFEMVETGYIVVIDTKPIQDLRETLKLPSGLMPGGVRAFNNTYLSPTAFQAWQTGFNSEIESIKTTTQELSQSYNNANSIFSTLSKLLTSSIQTLYDSLTSYLRF